MTTTDRTSEARRVNSISRGTPGQNLRLAVGPLFGRGLLLAGAVLGAVLLGGPLIVLCLAAFKSTPEVVAFPPTLLPEQWLWRNFLDAWELLGAQTFLNSVIFTIGILAIQTVLAMTSGFALAKMRLIGRTQLLLLFVATMLVPVQVTLVPTYIVVNMLGWIGSYAGLILPVAAQTGFGVFLFHQFYRNIPDDLIDAARMDGASWWTVFRRIAAPLSKPAMAAYASITFLTAWNMYAWPLVAASSLDMRVLPVALGAVGAENTTVPVNVGLAAVVLSTIPLAVVFILAERWFVQGLTASGLKE